MPIYEFRCQECGNEFEKFVISYSQAGSVKCPKCGSDKVVKKVSACAVGGSSGTTSAGGACNAFG
jgi:putative FmdB family regulatory protein